MTSRNINNKLNKSLFIFRWSLLLFVSCAVLLWQEILIVELDYMTGLIGFGVIILYFLMAHLLYFLFRKKPTFRIKVIKLLIIIDLMLILSLIYFTNGISSIFTLALFVILVSISSVFNRIGSRFIFLFLLICFLFICYLLEQLTLETSFYIVFYLLIFIFIYVFSIQIRYKEQDQELNPNLFKDQALIEPITSLYNHRSFQNTLLKFTSMDTPFSLILTDIDHFRKVNESYGYAIGDHVLSTYGHTLKYFQKDQNYYCFRYDRDGFAIILFETKERNIQNYIHLWNNLFEDSISQIKELNGENVTVSYGITVKRENDTKDDIIRRAESLLTKAKQKGNGIIYDQGEE